MKELFKNLGAGEKETQTFLRLLELGAQPVSIIARHIGVPRSSMYLILDNLKKLDLIEEFERFGIKYFKCIPAKNIAEVLHSRERKIGRTLEIFENYLPELETLENKLSITPKVKFFEGKDNVMKVYEAILKEDGFCAIFNPKIVKKIMPIYYYKVAETVKKYKLDVRELVVDCAEADWYKKTYNSKTHQIKLLPKNVAFDSDTIICKDKIYMISYGEKEVSATEIFNPSLAHTQRAIFEQMWMKN